MRTTIITSAVMALMALSACSSSKLSNAKYQERETFDEVYMGFKRIDRLVSNENIAIAARKAEAAEREANMRKIMAERYETGSSSTLASINRYQNPNTTDAWLYNNRCGNLNPYMGYNYNPCFGSSFGMSMAWGTPYYNPWNPYMGYSSWYNPYYPPMGGGIYCPPGMGGYANNNWNNNNGWNKTVSHRNSSNTSLPSRYRPSREVVTGNNDPLKPGRSQRTLTTGSGGTMTPSTGIGSERSRTTSNNSGYRNSGSVTSDENNNGSSAPAVGSGRTRTSTYSRSSDENVSGTSSPRTREVISSPSRSSRSEGTYSRPSSPSYDSSPSRSSSPRIESTPSRSSSPSVGSPPSSSPSRSSSPAPSRSSGGGSGRGR